MTPSAYRRETQAIERDAVRIRRVREEMQAALARLDDKSAAFVSQNGGSHDR